MREEYPRLVRKRLRLGEILRRRHLLELLERGALLAVEVRGDFKDYARVQIARRATAQRRNAFTAQSEHLAVRRAGGERELGYALRCRHVDRPAKRRENRRHRDVHAEVLAVALEDVALPNSDVNEEIAVLAAAKTAAALSGETKARAVVDAGGNLE